MGGIVGKENRLILVLVVLIIGVVVAVSGCTSDSKDSGSVLNVTDLKVVPGEYCDYKCTCTIVPSKDTDYMEMVGRWYDADGALIDTSPLMWNVNHVKAGQVVKVSGSGYLSGDKNPAKVQILIFDSVFKGGHESDAVFSQEVVLRG